MPQFLEVLGGWHATLTFMVGGTDVAYNKMLPLFDVMGKKSLLCGSPGSGQATKACNNMLLAISMIGVGEAFSLEIIGLDLVNYMKFCQLQQDLLGS